MPQRFDSAFDLRHSKSAWTAALVHATVLSRTQIARSISTTARRHRRARRRTGSRPFPARAVGSTCVSTPRPRPTSTRVGALAISRRRSNSGATRWPQRANETAPPSKSAWRGFVSSFDCRRAEQARARERGSAASALRSQAQCEAPQHQGLRPHLLDHDAAAPQGLAGRPDLRQAGDVIRWHRKGWKYYWKWKSNQIIKGSNAHHAPYNRTQSHTHGWVWLYLRKAEPARR